METKKNYTDEELREEFDKITKLLSEHDVPNDLKSSLEERKAIIAGMLMRHWLPADLGRKLIMLIILIVGISGVVSGKAGLLLVLLILPLFSPRIVAYIAIFIGTIKRNR